MMAIMPASSSSTRETNLVHMEFMILHSLLLNYLHFHSTLVGNDGRGIERVEQRWRGAVDGDKEVCRTGRIGGISQHSENASVPCVTGARRQA
jgi:hypothetical protein